MEFSQFYQNGGVFMHQILLCALVAAFFVFKGIRRRRDGDVSLRAFELGSGLVVAGLLFGGLGASMGVMEIGAALQSIPTEQWPTALARATPIAMTPLSFALMVAAPLWLFIVGGRHAARRA